MRKILVFLAGLILFSLPVFSHQLGLAPITRTVEKANRIFEGTCVDFQSSVENIGGEKQVVEIYTFEVTKWYKGEANGEILKLKKGEVSKAQYKVKQIRPFDTSKTMRHLFWVDYNVDEKYILLLGKEGEAGSFPLGYGQSIFTIKNGKVVNQYNNMKLFEKLLENKKLKSASKAAVNSVSKLAVVKSGAVEYSDFANLISALSL